MYSECTGSNDLGEPSALHHGLITLLQCELRDDSALIKLVRLGPEYSSKPALMKPSKCAGGTDKAHGSYSRPNQPSLRLFHYRVTLDAQVDVCFWSFWM